MSHTFHQVFDEAEHLSAEEQETLIGILQKRLADKRRNEIVDEIQTLKRQLFLNG